MAHHSGINVTKQAMDKRFNMNTKAMLTNLLQDVMSQQIHTKPTAMNWFTDIRIMDSSEFAVSKKAAATFPGYGGTGREALVQIQFEYQLMDSKVTQLSIGSALDSDSVEGMKHIDSIPPKTLLLRDLGYFSPKAFKELSKRNLYFISRAKSQWNFYTLEDGEYNLLTIPDIHNRLKSQNDKYIDLDVYVGEQHRVPVRLIANLLTKEQRQKRLEKKSANRKLGPDVLEGIGLNLFVTNVERGKCIASQVYNLYSLRWQVELVFKTWKSVIKLHKIHPMNATRLECVIIVKLIWVMLNWFILKHLKDVTGQDLSYHKLAHTLQSRAKALTLPILQSSNQLMVWLTDLFWISKHHLEKEYKNGRKMVPDILAKTYCDVA